MKTIYKYSIAPSLEPIKVVLPHGAQILSFGKDGFGGLSYWAFVDTKEEDEEIYLYCVGTGWNIEDVIREGKNIFYLGSVTTAEGYVWHLLREEKE